MSVWEETTIGEVADFVQGLALNAKTNHLLVRTGGLPLLRIKDLLENKVEFFVDENNVPKKCITSESDLILTRTGQVGYVFMGKKGVLHNNCFRIVPKSDRIYLPFIYWFFNRKSSREYLTNIAAGSVQPDLTHKIFTEVEIPLPPIQEQKAIASVLSSLDDKIDLLHRQNTTLERMAETLFRQWFVEEAQDSNIGQFIDLQNGYAFKSQDFKDIGEQRVLKIKNISGGIIDVNNTDFIDTAVASKTDAKFEVVTGDILFAMTGAEIGKLGIVPKTNTALWLNQRVGLLKEKFKGARFLAYLQLNSEIGQDYIENSATGSAQPNISGSLIEQCPFPKVEISKIKKCSEILDVYYQKLISNLGQIQTLEKLRDNMLPKLMSGEVRVEH